MSDLARKLAFLFPDADRARLLLRDPQINMDTGELDLSGPVNRLWEDILDEARKHHKVESVVEVAVLKYPERRTELVEAMQRYLAGRAPPEIPAGGVLRETDEAMERRYLDWLARHILNKSRAWHKTPIVPVPAHKKERPDLGEGWRASIFRHNPSDYALNPALSDSELSVRAGFGKSVKIKDLARELRKYSKIVVLGDPGSGKSVCLRQLAYDLAMRELGRRGRPETLPIFVEMGTYDGWQDPTARKPTPILEFLVQSLRTHEAIAEAPSAHGFLYHIADHLERLLQEGRGTCIFDALDEMPQESYQERYQALKRFMLTFEELNAKNRFIYSCRSLDYDPSFNVDEVIIDPFDLRRIRAFLRQNIKVPEVAEALFSRIREEESLAEIVSNPFFLQALAYINLVSSSAAAVQVPRTRGELIRLFVNTLFQREAVLKQREHLEKVGGLAVLERLLAELGYALQERPEGGTSALTESFADILGRFGEWRRLLWIARRARLLGKRGEDSNRVADAPPAQFEPPARVEFVHHRLQEFFAAMELARRLGAGDDVGHYLEDIWWQETVILAIGIVVNPRPIVERMIAPRPETDAWLRDVVVRAKQPILTEDVVGNSTDGRTT